MKKILCALALLMTIGAVNVNAQDADNDGILDGVEALTGCTTPTYKLERTTYDFESGSLANFSDIPGGGASATLTTGAFIDGIPTPNGVPTAVGEIIQAPGIDGTNTKLTAANQYIVNGARVIGDRPISDNNGNGYIGVSSFEFRKDYNGAGNDDKFDGGIHQKFVIEYDFYVESVNLNEYGTFISDGNAVTAYNKPSTANAILSYRGAAGHYKGSGGKTNFSSGITNYTYGGSAAQKGWHHFKSVYTYNTTTNVLTVDATFSKYDAAGQNLTTVGTSTGNYTASGAGFLTSGFEAGVIADYRFDNVEMYWCVCDTDGDGTPDFQDLDSDGDGCSDQAEGSPNAYNASNTSACPTFVGSIDCNKTKIISAPVAGSAGQKVMELEFNITTAGSTPITVSGSGFTLVGSSYTATFSSTGVQKIYVPVNYDGSPLATVTVNAGSAGTCNLDLTASGNVKDAVINVWSQDCLDTCGPQLN